MQCGDHACGPWEGLQDTGLNISPRPSNDSSRSTLYAGHELALTSSDSSHIIFPTPDRVHALLLIVRNRIPTPQQFHLGSSVVHREILEFSGAAIMSHVQMQPILTEDEIFSSPVISPTGPAGGDGFGDGSEEYGLEALRWDHESESEAFQWSMNSENGVHVHSESDQQMQLELAVEGEIPYDPAYVTHSVQTWPNEGINQAVLECHRRPRQRRTVKASYCNAVARITLRPVAIRPDHPKLQKFPSSLQRRRGPAAASLPPDAAPKPAAKRRRSQRPANPFTKKNDQLAAPPTEPRTVPNNFPSKLAFPFQLPNFQLLAKLATTTMPSMCPVYSDETRAPVDQRVATPSPAPDFQFGPAISSSAPVQYFVNPFPTLVERALVGLSPALAVDSTVTTTTRMIDPSQGLTVHDLSSDSECQLITDLPDSSSEYPEYQQVEWPNCIDYMEMSPAPDQAPESVPAELQATEPLHWVSNSQPAANISSPLVPKKSSRTKKQPQRTASEGSPDAPYAIGTREHSRAVAAKNGRLRWTPDLHDKFVAAVAALGGSEQATPKGVLRVMACPEITIFHVKSHLQKFRILPVPGQCTKRQRHERSLEAAIATEQMAINLEENVELQQEMQERLSRQLETTKDLQRLIDEQSAQLKRMLDEQQAQREAAGLQFALANTSDAVTQLPAQPSPIPPACNSVQVPRLVIVPNPLLYPPAADNTYGVGIASQAGGTSSSSPEVQPALTTGEPINQFIDSLEAEEMAPPTE